MMKDKKVMYFCVGCRQIHYDTDYNAKDGDLIFASLENVERSTLNFFLRRIKDQRLLTEEEKQTIQYIE